MKKLLIILFIVANLVLLSSCDKKTSQKKKEKHSVTLNTESISMENTTIKTFMDTFKKSAEELSVDWVNLAEYKKEYQTETKKVRKMKTQKLSFDNCKFYSIDDVEKVSVLKMGDRDVTPDESLKIIKEWLQKIGKKDINTDKEIRDLSGQYERNKKEEYPYYYPAVAEHYPNFETGRAFSLDTNDCYIQMGGDGIYAMSDGAITGYLNVKKNAGLDAVGANEEEVKKAGTLAEMREEAWELLSGQVSVGDAAELTKEYFMKGTPFPPVENITIDVPYVSAFKLKDKYGYAFKVRRKYAGIPFAYESAGNRTYYSEDYMIEGDDKTAYVVNDKTVSAYNGYNESQPIEEIIDSQKFIICLDEAVAILKEKLALQVQMQFESVEFVYGKCTFDDEDSYEGSESYAFPCWEFTGVNALNQEHMKIYVNALSGELYYYGYGNIDITD